MDIVTAEKLSGLTTGNKYWFKSSVVKDDKVSVSSGRLTLFSKLGKP